MKDWTTPELSPFADAFAASLAARGEKGQQNVPSFLQLRLLLLTPLFAPSFPGLCKSSGGSWEQNVGKNANKIFRPLSNRESVVRVVAYQSVCFATYFHLPRNWDGCLVRKAREQSVRDNILRELLPLQSVITTGNNENSRMTDRMSDSIDHFFSNNKELGLKDEKKWVLPTYVFAGFFTSRTRQK